MALTRRALLLAGLGYALTSCGRVAPPAGMRYRVRSGDTLAGISRQSGVAIADIIAANGLTSASLQRGQILLLPGISQLPQPALQIEAATEPVPAPTPEPAYRLVTRAEWQAPPPAANHRPMRGVRRITIHHTDEYPGMRGMDDPDVVRQICASHRGYRGWADIGYHYLIGADGTVYEGRSALLQGAHSGGNANRHNLGISLIGNFNGRLPPQPQLRALEALLAEQRRRHGVGRHQLWGHRDFKATDCPGHALYDWLWEHRSDSG